MAAPRPCLVAQGQVDSLTFVAPTHPNSAYTYLNGTALKSRPSQMTLSGYRNAQNHHLSPCCQSA